MVQTVTMCHCVKPVLGIRDECEECGVTHPELKRRVFNIRLPQDIRILNQKSWGLTLLKNCDEIIRLLHLDQNKGQNVKGVSYVPHNLERKTAHF